MSERKPWEQLELPMCGKKEERARRERARMEARLIRNLRELRDMDELALRALEHRAE